MTSTTTVSSSLKASILPAPLPTPRWGSQSWPAFTVRATNTIHAPSPAILVALLDTGSWSEWNSFVPRASFPPSNTPPPQDGRLQVGIDFTEHVDMAGKGRASRTQNMLMSSLQALGLGEDGTKGKGYRVVWIGKQFPNWALRSERVHEIREEEGEDGGVKCVYDDYETMSGPLALVVRLFVGGKLVQRFGQWNTELGEYVQGRKGMLYHKREGDSEIAVEEQGMGT